MQYTHYFPGQHSDEKVLYEVKPHPFALYTQFTLVLGTAAIIAILSAVLSFVYAPVVLVGFSLALLIAVLGCWAAYAQFNDNIAYLTDRRVIRFEATTPFHTATRAINWDDVMKIKTYPPSVIWSMLNIGTVVLHARSSIISGTGDSIQKEVTGDDLELRHVYYYKDLGNYIEKILHIIKKNPAELDELRPFIAKPRGKRY